MLTGFLRALGVEVLPIDANVEAYDAWLRPDALALAGARLKRRLARLERRASLDHPEQRLYLQLWRARDDAAAAPAGIAEARQVVKDAAAFFEPARYQRATSTI